jgi:hypothetical protein
MPLTKLQFRPGVNRETTSYANEGGWFDCDKVRFRFGTPEKIGGWQKLSIISYLGTARNIHAFAALDGERYRGVGTNLKYFIENGGSYADITPLRVTTSAGDVTFSATNGSSTITATDTGHGAIAGDFVTFSGAASLGGNITANVLNQEYEITNIVSDDAYQIEARTVSTIPSITTTDGLNPTFVFANTSDSGNGGGSIVGAYQINTGLDTTISGNGWGAGSWGRSTWGSGADLTASGQTLRIWSHDNFGEDLVINVRDGGLFYWDKSNASGVNGRSVALSSLAGANKVPTVAKQVMVSDKDRHVIAFGCDPETAEGTQDPLLIRFSDQENIVEWQSLVTNTAGDLRIGSGSKIITAIETRQQILVYTDVSLHAMQFLGPPFTFGINSISEGITIAGPLAAIAVEDNVFWMGAEEFYVYGGSVQRLPCSVRDYVFTNINTDQLEKVTAGVNSAFAEVTWFYPSASSTENDSYVTYNYQQKIWYYGTLSRTVWLDRGVNADPIAAGTDHYLYLHEIGFDDGSTTPVTAISAYIESSQMDLGEGEQFAFMRRLIPDMTFRNSTASTPTATMTLKVRNFPGGNYLDSNASSVAKTASVPVEQYTDQVYVRLRGRSFAFRIDSSDTGVAWRLGSPRVDIRPDGRR